MIEDGGSAKLPRPASTSGRRKVLRRSRPLDNAQFQIQGDGRRPARIVTGSIAAPTAAESRPPDRNISALVPVDTVTEERPEERSPPRSSTLDQARQVRGRGTCHASTSSLLLKAGARLDDGLEASVERRGRRGPARAIVAKVARQHSFRRELRRGALGTTLRCFPPMYGRAGAGRRSLRHPRRNPRSAGPPNEARLRGDAPAKARRCAALSGLRARPAANERADVLPAVRAAAIRLPCCATSTPSSTRRS